MNNIKLDMSDIYEIIDIAFKNNQSIILKVRGMSMFPLLKDNRDSFKLEHLLIAKTEVRGHYYGTIPEEREGKIGILILNTKGTEDLLNNPPLDREEYYIVGLDKLEAEVVREGRDEAYIAREREVLKYADIIYTLNKGEYADPEAVMREVLNFFDMHQKED